MVLRTSPVFDYHFRICDLNYMASYNNICYVSRDFSPAVVQSWFLLFRELTQLGP